MNSVEITNYTRLWSNGGVSTYSVIKAPYEAREIIKTEITPRNRWYNTRTQNWELYYHAPGFLIRSYEEAGYKVNIRHVEQGSDGW